MGGASDDVLLDQGDVGPQTSSMGGAGGAAWATTDDHESLLLTWHVQRVPAWPTTVGYL